MSSVETRSGKPVVVITGASQGIGRGIAAEFATHGHDLLLIARSEQRLLAVCDGLRRQFGVAVHPLALDVTRSDAPQLILDAVSAAGLYVETLVLNAAVWSEGPVVELPPHELRRIVEANVTSVCELATAVLPSMLSRRHGEILFVGSLAGNAPSPNNAVYAASKAFVKSFALSLRDECAAGGVNVSLLAPGVVDTAFTSGPSGSAGAHDTGRRLLAATPRSVGWVAYRGLKARQAMIVPSLFARTLNFGSRLLPPTVSGSLRRAFSRSSGQ